MVFETQSLISARTEDRTITIFLNRDCPRTCYQCGIADNSKRAMSRKNWIRALENLHNAFGATFFLFLGVEPLLLRDDMVSIVRYLRARKLDAAWYSTSPEPLFSRYRGALVEAGIQNWSTGIDTMPGRSMDPETDKKVVEGMMGLKWMADRGVPTHVTTTVHKKNLYLIPEIMRWVYSEIPDCEYAVNFIHWRQEPGFDFFTPPEDMKDMLWTGRIEEQLKVRSVMREVLDIANEVPSRRFHSSEGHLLNAHRFYSKLNLHCQHSIGPSVDADGTMRMCGYNTGNRVKTFSVLDLDNEIQTYCFNTAWYRDVADCSGCFWGCFKLRDDQYVPHAHPLNVLPSR